MAQTVTGRNSGKTNALLNLFWNISLELIFSEFIPEGHPA